MAGQVKMFMLATALLVALPASASLAQQVGSFVIVLEDANILSGNEPVEQVRRGMALKVRGSRPGGWLWVTRHQNGWIESKHVVPLQTALDYLAAEIAQQPRHAPFYNDRATVLFEIGDFAGAVRNYSGALQLVPGSFSLHANRAVAYFELGDYRRAAQDLNEVVRLRSDDFQSYIDRGWALYHAGQYEAALADYQQALKMDPNALEATINIAWMRATCPNQQYRDGAAALEMAEKACELTERKDPFALGTLAAAQAETGDYAAAVATQQQALELAPYTRKRLYRERLAFYTADQPYRVGAPIPPAKPAATAKKTSPALKTEPSAVVETTPQPELQPAVGTQPKSVLAPGFKPTQEKIGEGEPPAPDSDDSTSPQE